MTAGLRVSELHASHRRTAVLHGVDLVVPDRGLACILGPSGCGKTTLLRVIAGFHRPTSGTVELHERILDVPPRQHVPAERRRIGYIPQDVALFPHLSVAANVGFGLPRSQRAAKVAELLELTHLGPYAKRHPHQLSGGQQQRVALARALAPEPELLLLDEPFSALDASLRAQVRDDVGDLLRATATTAVLVTHDAVEALGFADQITVMSEGRVLQTGTPEQLHASPDNVVVARALGDTNVLAARIADGIAHTVLGDLPVRTSLTGASTGTLAASAHTSVLVRPRQLIVSAAPVGSTDITGSTTPAVVRRSSFQGLEHRLEVDVAGTDRPVIVLTVQAPALGSTVHLRVDGPVHPLAD